MSNDMSVKDIVKEFLTKNGYDGLCYEGCGCPKDDLMPCSGNAGICFPAYAHTKKECADCGDKDDCYDYNGIEIIYCVKPLKKVDAKNAT